MGWELEEWGRAEGALVRSQKLVPALLQGSRPGCQGTSSYCTQSQRSLWSYRASGGGRMVGKRRGQRHQEAAQAEGQDLAAPPPPPRCAASMCMHGKAWEGQDE